MRYFPILGYHNISAVPTGIKVPNLHVTPSEFDRQMSTLHRLGFSGQSLSAGFHNATTHPSRKIAILTFDDGYLDNLQEAAPILKRYGFSATCYLVSDLIGRDNVWDSDRVGATKPLMNASQIGQWLDAGMEIGSHSRNHVDLTTVSDEQAEDEIVTSRAALTRQFNVAVTHFCYPYGRHNEKSMNLVKRAGYVTATSQLRGFASRQSNAFCLPRIAIAGQQSFFKFVLRMTTPYEICCHGFADNDLVNYSIYVFAARWSVELWSPAVNLSGVIKRGLKATGIIPKWHYLFRSYRPLPTDRQTVNKEYRSGHWNALRDIGELPRFHIIAGYCQHLNRHGSILDIGCGEGMLQQSVQAYSHYLGIDLSDEAIRQAASRQNASTQFCQADATTFCPDKPFDVIVFNECLFYFKNPAETVTRYVDFLSPGGAMIVSMYEMGLDRHIWKTLESHYSVAASVRIQNKHRVAWNIRVLKPIVS